MPRLIATFTRAFPHPPRMSWVSVKVGSYARSEIIEIGVGGCAGDLVSRDSEQIVDLKAEVRCWVTIGPSADPAVGQGHYLDQNEREQFWVEPGQRVAVIADTAE